MKTHTLLLALLGSACSNDIAGSAVDGGSSSDSSGHDGQTAQALRCAGGGLGGHAEVSFTYIVDGPYGDYVAAAAANSMKTINTMATDLGKLPGDMKAIPSLTWELFDFEKHIAKPDVPDPEGKTPYDRVFDFYGPHIAKIEAFNIIDEPYLAGWGIPRPELEKAIAALKLRFPTIPTFINFAADCFDPASTFQACSVEPSLRGIPSNVDWVSFDAYSNSSDIAIADGHFDKVIRPMFERLAELAPDKKKLLVAEAFESRATDIAGNVTVGQSGLSALMSLQDYMSFAKSDPRVFGIGWFLMADVTATDPNGTKVEMIGLESIPYLKNTIRAFEREFRYACGETPQYIPIEEWYNSLTPDTRYHAWHWAEAKANGYGIHGVGFLLAPENSPGTVPLHNCLITANAVVDSYLTLSNSCDGLRAQGPAEVLGGIFTEQVPGTVPLRKRVLNAPPWDHVYSVDPTTPAGYLDEGVLGFVYPASLL